jgi:hypothetical protein
MKNGHTEPPLGLVTAEDVDRNQPVPSEWDRIHRILANIFETLQDIQKTQTKQTEVAEQSCARLTIIESKLK